MIAFPFGNVVPVNIDYILDLFHHPKLIDLNTGKIVSALPDILTGEIDSSISSERKYFPPIAIDMPNNRIAVATKDGIQLIQII